MKPDKGYNEEYNHRQSFCIYVTGNTDCNTYGSTNWKITVSWLIRASLLRHVNDKIHNPIFKQNIYVNQQWCTKSLCWLCRKQIYSMHKVFSWIVLFAMCSRPTRLHVSCAPIFVRICKTWAICEIQWNLSITTTSIIKFIPCDLFSNVF